VLTSDRELAEYFETAHRDYPQPKKLANWIMTEIMRELKGDEGIDIRSFPVKPGDLAALLAMIDQGTISGKIAKTVFEEMFKTGKEAAAIVEAQGLTQITDEGALEASVVEVLAAHPKELAEYKAGRTKLFGFFMGRVLEATSGKGNPQAVQEILRRKLSE